MDIFKEEAIKEFKAKVMYIGAFVEGPLPKNNRIISEELPDKNPENGNHVTLFYLGSIPTISEELFDDIMNLPEGFTVTVAGYDHARLLKSIQLGSLYAICESPQWKLASIVG